MVGDKATPYDVRFQDLTGERFGRWTVLRFVQLVRKRKHSYRTWLCRCECGAEREIRTAALRNGASQGCGCRRAEVTSKAKKTHGRSKTREYLCWQQMVTRCENENCKSYRNYGARGIRVCPRWRVSFEAFVADMGPRPPGMTIERENNNGDYCPENCKWATRAQQARNKRSNLMLTYKGETKCLADWSDALGIPYDILQDRITHRRWTLERAFTEPFVRRQ